MYTLERPGVLLSDVSERCGGGGYTITGSDTPVTALAATLVKSPKGGVCERRNEPYFNVF